MRKIGLIGNWSTLSFNFNLCILVVPQNFPEQEPIGYKRWYSYMYRIVKYQAVN